MTSRIGAAASAERTEPPAPPAGADRETGRRPDRSLPARVLMSVLFLPLLVLMAWAGGWVYLAFTLVAIALMLGEFYAMMEAKGISPHWRSGYLAALLLPWVSTRGSAPGGSRSGSPAG